MKWDGKRVVVLSGLLAACSAQGPLDEPEAVGVTEQAVSVTNDGIPIATVSSTTYLDISTSNTQYYVLLTSGVKRVNHTVAHTIPSVGLWLSTQLNRIDYVNTTWGLTGVRNKNGATPAQLVLKLDQASPRTVNLPSDINAVKDFEARQNTSNLLEIYLMVESGGNHLIKKYTYNWSANTLTYNSQITQDLFTSAFTLPASNYAVTYRVNLNLGLGVFRKSFLSGAIGNIEEDYDVVIDSYGNPASGDMEFIAHGYFTPTKVNQLGAVRLDYGKFNNSAENYYVAMSTGSVANTYDFVRYDASYITFVKTPTSGEFSFWNGNDETLSSNNCYNYAGNHKTSNFAQPGYGGANQYLASMSPTEIRNKAALDGLEYVGNQATGWPTVPAGKTLVAAISGLAPSYNVDYHWFRRNVANGVTSWTHKPGWCNATNRKYPFTQAAAVITDPRDPTAWDQSYYDTFVGFFLVDSSGEAGKGIEDINGWSTKRSGGGCGFYYPGQPLTAMDTATTSAKQTVPPHVVVSVGLYSGRPNPEMVVEDPATIDQLRAAYAEVQQQGGTPEGVSPGYQGVFVSNPCGLSGLPSSFRLHTPPTSGAASARSLQTAAAGAEIALLDLAAQKNTIDATQRSGIRARAGK